MPKDISSPFTPGQPVPVEFFAGRIDEVERLNAMVARSLQGRLQIGFITGERAIGKSSLASFVRHLAERDSEVIGLHAFLGGVGSLEEMVRRVFNKLLTQTAGSPVYEAVKGFFGDHVRQVGLFGISVEFEASSRDLQHAVNDFGRSLNELYQRIKDQKKGILLVLDDINGLASQAEFANWVKSLVDEISTSGTGLPLCMLFVGVEDRRQSLINLQPSLTRVFDLIEIRNWSEEETSSFYDGTFGSVGIKVEQEALGTMSQFVGGFPALAHEIGDAAFIADDDARVDEMDAVRAVAAAAEVVGRKHLEPRVFRSISSENHRKLLTKIAELEPGVFRRADLMALAVGGEASTLDGFLGKMLDLGVFVREQRGVYRVASDLYHVYFAMGDALDPSAE